MIKELFINKNNRNLDKADVKKFYILQQHYNQLSPNIAIVGDYNKFKKYTKKLLQRCKNNKEVFIRSNNNKLIIIDNGIETNYIKISKIDDVYGIYFRKYI